MIFNLFRIFFLLFLVLFQYSFLNFIFFQNFVPNVVMVFVVSYVAILGFDRSWKGVVILGVFVDLFTFSVFGKNIIVSIILAYFVSLISRRLLLEKHDWRPLLVFFLVLFVMIFYNIIEILWLNNNFSISNILWVKNNFSFFGKSVLVQTIFGVILFYLMHKLLGKFEQSVSFYDRKILS